jgi:hypothetical protein
MLGNRTNFEAKPENTDLRKTVEVLKLLDEDTEEFQELRSKVEGTRAWQLYKQEVS